MSGIAVFDVGKTNVKLTVTDSDGRPLETLSRPNPVRPGPPYPHHDLAAMEDFLLDGLRELGRRHAIDAIVPVGHGAGGVLVGPDGPALPMMDYEQPASPGLDEAYGRIAGSFRERGSAIMLGTTHLARQMLWAERDWPAVFGRAIAMLATPQYWAWRLSGVAASEVTSLAAQSHLWCAIDGRPAHLVAERGWGRLLPPLTPAWRRLGPLTAAVQARTGLGAEVGVLCGIHDSSANLYRYQAGGLADMTVVSTGTWIVAISDRPGPDFAVEQPGLTCNADVHGRPFPGVLTMGGREFTAVAGGDTGLADAGALARLLETRTMALPSFGDDDGLFPGTARTGRVVGSLAGERAVQSTLAVLYAALLTERCLAGANTATIVLDGSFVRDPLYGAVLAALLPDRAVRVNLDQHGVATGAALLAGHESRHGPARLTLHTPPPLPKPGLLAYRDAWQAQVRTRRPS